MLIQIHILTASLMEALENAHVTPKVHMCFHHLYGPKGSVHLLIQASLVAHKHHHLNPTMPTVLPSFQGTFLLPMRQLRLLNLVSGFFHPKRKQKLINNFFFFFSPSLQPDNKNKEILSSEEQQKAQSCCFNISSGGQKAMEWKFQSVERGKNCQTGIIYLEKYSLKIMAN